MADVTTRLKRAAEHSFKPLETVASDLRSYYSSLYRRVMIKNKEQFQASAPIRITKKAADQIIKKYEKQPNFLRLPVPVKQAPLNVGRYTRANLTIEAQEELQKKIISSIELIKLNREVAVAKTMQRLAGWVSSVPPEGTEIKANKEALEITKALKQLPHQERRVIIDQGHKLVSSLEDVVSRGSGAIAAMWHSHVHQAGYNYRHSHAEMDEKVYIIKDAWADKEGMVKALHGYTTDHEMPAELINCRCYYSYLFNLKDLPLDMLTKKAQTLLSQKEYANGTATGL